MKPEQRPDTIQVYTLFQLDPNGKFILGHISATEQGDMGVGVYSTLQKAQNQQLVLALKGIKVEVFTIDFPLPV